MEYITENKFEDILEGIKMDNCVLILGPLFGMDAGGNKIQTNLRQKLINAGFPLDDEFQNLFIAEQSADDWGITSKIITFYDNAVPHDIYNVVAKIKFNSILTFTQDVFLLNAFKKQKFEYNFKYFSSAGSKQNEEINLGKTELRENEIENKNKVPVIYNVFGYYKDSNSLIINYSSFYEFLFSILGEKKPFPLELITKLSESKVFVFLGFDLKKWYVPLLITKLYNLGRDINNQRRPMAVSALNDTDTSNEEYVRWLTRYPLLIKFIEGNSQQFIDKVSAVKDENIFRKSLPEPRPREGGFPDDPEFQKNKRMYLDKIAGSGSAKELFDVSKEINSFFSGKYANGQNFITEIQGELTNLMYKISKGENNTGESTLNNIRNRLIDFINPYP